MSPPPTARVDRHSFFVLEGCVRRSPGARNAHPLGRRPRCHPQALCGRHQDRPRPREGKEKPGCPSRYLAPPWWGGLLEVSELPAETAALGPAWGVALANCSGMREALSGAWRDRRAAHARLRGQLGRCGRLPSPPLSCRQRRPFRFSTVTCHASLAPAQPCCLLPPLPRGRCRKSRGEPLVAHPASLTKRRRYLPRRRRGKAVSLGRADRRTSLADLFPPPPPDWKVIQSGDDPYGSARHERGPSNRGPRPRPIDGERRGSGRPPSAWPYPVPLALAVGSRGGMHRGSAANRPGVGTTGLGRSPGHAADGRWFVYTRAAAGDENCRPSTSRVCAACRDDYRTRRWPPQQPPRHRAFRSPGGSAR